MHLNKELFMEQVFQKSMMMNRKSFLVTLVGLPAALKAVAVSKPEWESPYGESSSNYHSDSIQTFEVTNNGSAVGEASCSINNPMTRSKVNIFIGEMGPYEKVDIRYNIRTDEYDVIRAKNKWFKKYEA